MKKNLREKEWYPYTVTACIGVALYVGLTNLGAVTGALKTFFGYFEALILGGVLAYMMNPLALLYQRKLFRHVRQEKFRWPLSVALTVISLLMFITFMLGTLIPQLVDSISTLIGNMDGYLDSLQSFLAKQGFSDTVKLEQFLDTSGSVMTRITDYLMKNASGVLNVGAAAGKGIVRWAIALILSVYFLAAKDNVKNFTRRLMHAILPQKRYDETLVFLTRCDSILVQYIVCSLLDAAIVGLSNMIFMICFGMQYVGLVSLVVAVFNLIPTFGPLIGGAIGGFILLLVNPLHALIFIIFTMILQFLDGYVIKPKMFGSLLGVSGLLILAMIIVCGSMFGIVGILLAIPIAAILDFIYEEGILPALEKRRREQDRLSAQPDAVEDIGEAGE